MLCYFCVDTYECGRTKILTFKNLTMIRTFSDKQLGLHKEKESIGGWMFHGKTSKHPKQQGIAL